MFDNVNAQTSKWRDQRTFWTPERINLLRNWWLDGHSATQIAKALGLSVTRNAVIGKVHRLGLSNVQRPKPVHPKLEPSRLLRGRVISSKPKTAPYIQPLEPSAIPVPRRVTITELREFMCRWPIGDPGMPDFRYCGLKSVFNRSYCCHHCKIAYETAPRQVGAIRHFRFT